MFVIAKETGESSAAKVDVELRKALDERSVALTDLESLFPSELPPNRATSLVKDGLDAVDNLDFDSAQLKFNEALTFLEQNPALAEAKELANVHLHLANIALQIGGKPGQKQAAEHVTKAMVYFPAVELEPKYFGSNVKKLVDKALLDLSRGGRGSLAISTSPLGAEITFRGAVLGSTPLAEAPTVPVGKHLVSVRKPGFKPAGAFVTVTKEGGQVSVELNEVEGYAAAFKAMKNLVPANLGKGVPREAHDVGRTMKSRYLIVTEVAPGGEGQVEVWDVESKNRLKELALPTDGNFGPLVDKVKGFLANPSPVAVATTGKSGTGGKAGGGDAPVDGSVEEPASGDSVLSKWWFWAAVGGVVAVGAGVGIGVAAANGAPAARPGFNPILGAGF